MVGNVNLFLNFVMMHQHQRHQGDALDRLRDRSLKVKGHTPEAIPMRLGAIKPSCDLLLVPLS